ncbi:hypothetical protein DSO57_1025789 [Entomophthora muscae]|uniref:Uncharacterized protein n=1 Tax=Entomophthora muscae TaxID=34485 RepID=A0ACC2T2A8_9FUNG|nr:hypothetical protein DSO57_1025789 [Entomophthora muscae]
MNWLLLQEIWLFSFLTLRNSLAPLMLVASDPTVLIVYICIFVFVSSVLPRPSLATPSRDYSFRAASTNPILRLGFPVVCLCCASEHNKQGKLQSKVPDKPPLVPTPSLDQWRAKAREIKHKRIAGGTKHLKARYAVGGPVHTLNPNSAKLEPNHLGPFRVAAVYNNHTY